MNHCVSELRSCANLWKIISTMPLRVSAALVCQFAENYFHDATACLRYARVLICGKLFPQITPLAAAAAVKLNAFVTCVYSIFIAAVYVQ